MRFSMLRPSHVALPALIALVLVGAAINAAAAETATKAKAAKSSAVSCTKKGAQTDHSDPHKSMKDAEGCAKPAAKEPKLTQMRTGDITYPNGDRSTRK